ncbi:MAG: methyl-accepting chemotaxis protein [Pseudomonadota bacterium]|nr:methyl-accepting chemotaxis protein [Pseudomonadota bacterium]
MLLTVRARILFFAVLSLGAVAGLAALSWAIILKAETTSNTLVERHLEPSWLLVDLEQDHRRLQELAFKIKAQLLLWGDITTEFEALSGSLNTHWRAVQAEPELSGWASEHASAFASVQGLMDDMAAGIAEKSYYRVGQVVDFQLFSSIEPMLDAIRERQQISRNGVTGGAKDLLAFLNAQQGYLLAGAAVFFVVVVLMALWLRRSVILRLQTMEQELVLMEREADLTRTPSLGGRDEVAGVAGALEGLVARFEQFIADIRMAAAGLDERSGALDSGAEALRLASDQTRQQIDDVTEAMRAIADQASQIESATARTAATIRDALDANGEVQDGLRQSQSGAEHTVEVIGRMSLSIHDLTDSTGKIEQVTGVIADIAEQTNLLALNAAIEAARAGEHGRGFAVVADEVRTLSRRTAESTQNIRQWVQDLVSGVSGVDELLTEMRQAGQQNQSNLGALKHHLERLGQQFGELEHQSEAILGSVSLQRSEVSRVGRRAEVLADSAGALTDSVEQTRRISDALREESLSMRQLAGGFRTREAV